MTESLRVTFEKLLRNTLFVRAALVITTAVVSVSRNSSYFESYPVRAENRLDKLYCTEHVIRICYIFRTSFFHRQAELSFFKLLHPGFFELAGLFFTIPTNDFSFLFLRFLRKKSPLLTPTDARKKTKIKGTPRLLLVL